MKDIKGITSKKREGELGNGNKGRNANLVGETD